MTTDGSSGNSFGGDGFGGGSGNGRYRGSSAAGGIAVVGGVGGIRFRWEQLLAAARQLDTLAAELAAVNARVRELDAVLAATRPAAFGVPVIAIGTAAVALPATVSAPAALWRTQAGLDQARRALAAAQQGLEHSADAVRHSRANYYAAEARVGTALRSMDNWTAYIDGLALRFSALALMLSPPLAIGALAARSQAELNRAKLRGYRDEAQARINSSPEFLGAVLGLPPGVAGLLLQDSEHGGLHGSPIAGRYALMLRNVADSRGLIRKGTLRLTPLATTEVPPARPGEPRPGSLEWAFAGSAAAYDPAHPKINIREIIRPDQSTVWSVDVPGTQDWGLDSASLFDVEGNLRGITQTDTAARGRELTQVMQLVDRSLAALKVPDGAAIILNGHSAGGIHAAALAGNRAFTGKYAVKALNTAGAPIANFDIDPRVMVLAMEHRDDIVPALDGMPNPDRRNWITTTSTAVPLGGADGPAGTLAHAHEMANYLNEAAKLDAGSNPSVIAHKAALAALVPPGAKIVLHSFQGTDINPPAPRRSYRKMPARAGRPPVPDQHTAGKVPVAE